MSTVTKDVLYIDVDDEITALIDRLTASDHKVVALVLPKRATVLQSIVNMKLLKRAADEHNKHVVLVTSETGLLPLAGAVGLHVAHTPNSKPVIPKKPDGMADEPVNVDESELTEEDFDPKASAAAPVGVLAGATDNEETIQLDNEPEPVAAGAGGKSHKSKAAQSKKGKNKKLKVPNFNAFRKKSLLIGGGLLLLLLIWIFGFMVLPKATIAVKTDSQDVNKRLDITFDTSADAVDTDGNTVPSVVEQTQKVATQTVQASGQKNDGEVAKGSITFQVQRCDPPFKATNIPAGTGVSSNGVTYITQKTASFGNSPDEIDGGCAIYYSNKVDITGQAPGAKYNVANASFTVNQRSDATGSGSAKGGTDDIVKVVTQADIDSLKQKLSSQVDSSVQGELTSKLQDRNLYVIKDSFNTGTPEVTVSAQAGNQVDSVNATQKTTYSLVGVKKQDIEDLITKKVEEDIDTKKQRVLNTGLDQAVFKLQNQQNNSAQVQMSMDITALAGPKLDDEQIKEQIAGKKSGEVRDILKNYPGVTDVSVTLSPFWVTSVPKSASKITITYEK